MSPLHNFKATNRNHWQKHSFFIEIHCHPHYQNHQTEHHERLLFRIGFFLVFFSGCIICLSGFTIDVYLFKAMIVSVQALSSSNGKCPYLKEILGHFVSRITFQKIILPNCNSCFFFFKLSTSDASLLWDAMQVIARQLSSCLHFPFKDMRFVICYFSPLLLQ